MSTSTLQHDPVLTALLAHRSGPCVTILMHTHRTAPDNAQDRIRLKDLVKKAEKDLLEQMDKRGAAPILENLEALVTNIDHQQNADGLALFAAVDLAETVRLPFPVDDRVVVEGTFATREVVRARLGSVSYHVLALGREKAHLYQATDDHLIGEVRGAFPLKNRHWTTDASRTSTARGQDNQLRHYHVDLVKALNDMVDGTARVVVASTQEHYAAFMDAAKYDPILIGHLGGSHDHLSPAEVVKQAWPIAYEDQKARHAAELEQVQRAASDHLTTAVADIWRRVREGRGAALYVERDLRIPVRLEGDAVVQVDDPSMSGAIDDIVDDIIEEQLRHGGDVRILPNGMLGAWSGIVLLLRY
ncbi:MAG: hypothetical protein H6597_04350 [Flavobacteriales bacterium]|nr:hypothetical protein [Flavobacteriales bacterium]